MVKYFTEILEDKNPRDDDEWAPLHHAAQNGHVNIVEYLAEHLEDKNPASKDGWTPIELATTNGHLKVVEYLEDILKHEITVNDGDNPTKP